MSRWDRTRGGMAALWLGLVEQRCLRNAAESANSSMTPADRVALLDAAMTSRDTAAYLSGVQKSFELSGRKGDAVLAAALRALVEAGEIETVMRMRARWKGGGDAALSNPDLAL